MLNIKQRVLVFFLGIQVNICCGQIGDVKQYLDIQLEIVQNFYEKGKNVGDEHDNAVKVLEELTGIMSYESEGYVNVKIPSIFNIQDWNEWIEINSDILYFDTYDNKVKVNGTPKMIVKNPRKEYLKFLKIIKVQLSSKDIEINKFDFAIKFIHELTGIRYKEYSVYPSLNVPDAGIVEQWEQWFQQNQSLLRWDSNAQKVVCENCTH